ncbi:MAG: glucokinase [Cypionkella sp.]
MTELVAVDIGGTHARFARAEIAESGSIALDEPVTLRTGDYPNFALAWEDFAHRAGPLPRAAAIAAAGPLLAGHIKLTNAAWALDFARLRAELSLEAITGLNDFAAVAHAVARLPADRLAHVAGPDRPLPERGTISVIGPGTGLGVAQVHRANGGYHVQPSEGGHVGFAPQDPLDDRIVAALRRQYDRVVTEHVVAGPGIAAIYAALGGGEPADDRSIWQRGLARTDELASAAVDRFCASLGSAAGDYALAHGASAVVLAGGIGLRLRERLPASGFAQRFCAKPRYQAMMAAIPVKLVIHPQPGLYGAVAAFQLEHPR